MIDTRMRCFMKMLKGEVIAIFPDEHDYPDKSLCDSYMIIGQHGACHYNLRFLPNASPLQYRDILKELISYPYEYQLKIIGSREWQVLTNKKDNKGWELINYYDNQREAHEHLNELQQTQPAYKHKVKFTIIK